MNPTILLVEDNYLVGLALKRSLEATGAVVIGPCADARDGLARARTESYDLAILDIRIRGDTSFSIAEAVRGHGRPVIFVSGYGDETTVPAAFRDAPMLAKPADLKRLEAEIATVLAS